MRMTYVVRNNFQWPILPLRFYSHEPSCSNLLSHGQKLPSAISVWKTTTDVGMIFFALHSVHLRMNNRKNKNQLF